jgi:hypothetical protein
VSEDPRRLELFILMECAESPFGLGRSEDHRWNVEHPGSSPASDLVEDLEQRGCLIVAERFDAEVQRTVSDAEITKEGRRRIDELIAEGVEPSEGWL